MYELKIYESLTSDEKEELIKNFFTLNRIITNELIYYFFKEFKEVQALTVFGDRASGEYDEESDFDIMVEISTAFYPDYNDYVRQHTIEEYHNHVAKIKRGILDRVLEWFNERLENVYMDIRIIDQYQPIGFGKTNYEEKFFDFLSHNLGDTFTWERDDERIELFYSYDGNRGQLGIYE